MRTGYTKLGRMAFEEGTFGSGATSFPSGDPGFPYSTTDPTARFDARMAAIQAGGPHANDNMPVQTTAKSNTKLAIVLMSSIAVLLLLGGGQ